MRDSQRSKVYASDHSLDAYGRLETVTAIEYEIGRLWKSKRFQAEFYDAWRWGPPKVGDGRCRRRANGSFHQIKMPKWSRTRGMVAHELAHTVHLRMGHGRKPQEWQWHGWEFCSIYLRLVHYMMGTEAHDALKAALKQNRVKYRKPIKRRPLSPEQRAVNIARLSVYNGTAATE
jgi:hypothetical protein